MLDQNKALKSFLKEERRLQKGKYKLRQTVYVFLCSDGCGVEIEVRKSDLKKVSGRCRECTDKKNGVLSSVRNRKKPFESLYNKFVYDRKRFEQTCTITYEQFLMFTKFEECHYCAKKLEWSRFRIQDRSSRYNLDRKDSTGGYTVENCVVCCWECNELKGNRLTYGEMLVAMQAICEYRAQRGQQVYESGDVCDLRGGSCGS
jgi:hypothetical protein